MTETSVHPSPDRPSSRSGWKLHIVCYVLLAGILTYLLLAQYLEPLIFNETIGTAPDRVQMVEQRIDPNIAHWSELARLPGIGEMRAKRIAAYRREQAAALQSGSNDTAILFFRLEDLDPIKGIGPKTLARIEPFLKFPSPQGQGAR